MTFLKKYVRVKLHYETEKKGRWVTPCSKTWAVFWQFLANISAILRLGKTFLYIPSPFL